MLHISRKADIQFLLFTFLLLASTCISLSRSGSPTSKAAQEDWKSAGGVPAGVFEFPRSISCPDQFHCWAVGWRLGETSTNPNLEYGAKSTNNGGEIWQNIIIQDMPKISEITFLDKDFGFSGNNGTTNNPGGIPGLARTKDGGRTWERINERPIYSIVIVNRTTVFFTSGEGTYKSSDSGNTWELWSNIYLPKNIRFLDENIAWVIQGQSGSNYASFTIDGGRNWTEVFPAGDKPANITSVYFIDSQNGWVSGRVKDQSGTIVARTRDAGQSWQVFPIPNSAEFLSPIGSLRFLTLTEGWGTSGPNIVRTFDGGVTWSIDFHNQIAPISIVDIFDAAHGWAVASGGSILR